MMAIADGQRPQPLLGKAFRGPVSAVIFDWAGTVLDFGCIAPVAAFREAFAEEGLSISEAEARAPMGAAKREHIALILAQPDVSRRWRAEKGHIASETDIDRLYAAFLRIDAVNCARYSALIPGALEAVAHLRAQNIAIGSTTGYPRSVMDGLMPLASMQGYEPDHCVTVSDVSRGRPYPDMVLANALALGAPDVRACVVVDDSPTGLVAARAAGMWAVGIIASGNEVGLSLADWLALDDAEQAARREAARIALNGAGAHFTIDTIADLSPVIAAINARLLAGDKP
ncbi:MULTISPECIES: phosphonoacetaldehyde hydrolase [unclassified Chelatococcus]|uniref:phosphonoacetaldehyde hydrolase n=1 Tax=unclassified Chelatococcus TaxID=2638111 RepID=UPI001BCAEB0F|nr:MULTISPECIES: phosphonoacetaldehyde hydrolase [unclassified Chelatococcus]MBS7700598.1 phosphonoacetaldehyde hydrolase [Chelatococcus sp. YT9]MBX3558713.1 phosphonoacetaldehyde hydrolase [Chelatococcus sp.]